MLNDLRSNKIEKTDRFLFIAEGTKFSFLLTQKEKKRFSLYISFLLDYPRS
uniref:Uncharacterized protein n=1 Tax=Arundo donax TaxID=35708 RepID=A0A0A9CG14_ARUDO